MMFVESVIATVIKLLTVYCSGFVFIAQCNKISKEKVRDPFLLY